jgi:hypothetical protein
MKRLMDAHLHKISLDIAQAFKDHWHAGEKAIANELLTAYRNIRRHIGKADNGKRHGSDEAHRAMRS